MHAEVIRFFVRGLLDRHPLPWRIDHDWTVEVLDAKGACVAKFQTNVPAQDLIAYAEKLAEDDAKAAEETRRFLREAGIEIDDG